MALRSTEVGRCVVLEVPVVDVGALGSGAASSQRGNHTRKGGKELHAKVQAASFFWLVLGLFLLAQALSGTHLTCLHLLKHGVVLVHEVFALIIQVGDELLKGLVHVQLVLLHVELRLVPLTKKHTTI